MSTAQAKALARKLCKEGKTYDEIGHELAKKEFVGPRSGKPIAASTLSFWLNRPKKKKPEAQTVKTAPKKRSPAQAICTVLNSNVSTEEKLDLIRVLVEHL